MLGRPCTPVAAPTPSGMLQEVQGMDALVWFILNTWRRVNTETS